MPRWNIKDERTIEWHIGEGDVHTDDIEMAGFAAVDVVTYGVENDGFVLLHHPVFPTLRTRPNDTHASYQRDVTREELPKLLKNGETFCEKLVRVQIDGTLKLFTESDGIAIEHTVYPSPDRHIVWERVSVKNASNEEIALDAILPKTRLDKVRGPFGDNLMEYTTDFEPTVLRSGESYIYAVGIYGRLANEAIPRENFDEAYEARLQTVQRLTQPLVLETGNPVLDTAFRFAKIRAGESIYDTKCGKIHSPGGLSYYAATWCNDEIEYAGPYFAYTADAILADAAMNAFRMYMPFMSDDYEPIPSSVIAEGLDFWHGKGDRGDAAMYLFGASRFALMNADKNAASELLPYIEWCAEYCERKKTADGVIASDSDEMEERLPSGDANLCTSCLTFAGLRTAAALEREFGNVRLADEYETRAEELKAAIGRHFSAEIHGFKTYRYYEGCEVLRSWSAIPLSVGIFERAEGTVASLVSEYMMRPDGFRSAEGCDIIWDRSNLYAIRGIFASGMTDVAADIYLKYAENRLLGERVPYPVEAYPEGGRRHLSGESALFIKALTDGLLGMEPTGFKTFTLKPYLPEALERLHLKSIRAHGGCFDVLVEKDGFRVVGADGSILGEGALGEKKEITVK